MASLATLTPPSVPFLKPTGQDRPLASWRWLWLSVVRAPMAPQLTRSLMNCGDSRSRNSVPTGRNSWTCCRRNSSATWSAGDRKSTRLNSSHSQISYAVFCLKKKKPHQADGHEIAVRIHPQDDFPEDSTVHRRARGSYFPRQVLRGITT